MDEQDVVIGWRAWRVVEESASLRSVYRTDSWPARKPLVAKCVAYEWAFATRQQLHTEPAPILSCSCGIYAVGSRDEVTVYLRGMGLGLPYCIPQTFAIGQVSLAGRVVKHKSGWRGELAYPYSLYVYDKETAGALGALYGVETHLLDPLPELSQ
jgi:hypothetical protein